MSPDDVAPATEEGERLREVYEQGVPWRRWGPYLSERQWGTVREDHSDDGAGLGASHQIGWTGIIARLIQGYAYMTPEQILTPAARQLNYRKRAAPPPPAAPTSR
ncbi:hypothetical protein SZ63_03075 [Methanoculleus sediminis]|uniref:Uncharacterized protein n=1 Tax=Methanoculleus sediminis TaxID=1550566 RepID=A0A0H1QZN7_9EURY|nr:hypothetical protein [Methanoculleus sediminis]KLK88066.1 hypothetical protein SZ63_03075 [Methanoculleus sediminis]